MDNPMQIFSFPEASTTALSVFAALCVALLLFAVLIEVRRRRDRVNLRAKSEWRTLHAILAEHNFSERETGIIEALVKKHALETPLRAVTVRQVFDECMEAEMAQLRQSGATEVFVKAGTQLRDIRTQLGLDYVPVGQRISTSRNLYSGQGLSVARTSDTEPRWFRMMVEAVDEAFFHVSDREKPGKQSPDFRKGEEVRCRMWRDEDARYAFITTVDDIEQSPPGWRLNHTGAMDRVQARAHFRVRHDQTTVVEVLDAPLDKETNNLAKRRVVTKLRGRITSISAGGCALVLQQPVTKQVLLRIAIELPRAVPVEAVVSIIACTAISGGRYHVRLTFVGLDDERRDRIAKYVLQRQQAILAGTQSAVE
jgi:c-di-GMP-binding flagellar brake protein YcgR